MATRNHTREVLAFKKTRQDRFLTVQLHLTGKSKKPWIRLHGLWLLEAGFTSQTRIRVRVMNDCLLITKEQNPRSPLRDLSSPK